MGNSKSKQSKQSGNERKKSNSLPELPPSYESLSKSSSSHQTQSNNEEIIQINPPLLPSEEITLPLPQPPTPPYMLPKFSLKLPEEETTAEKIAACYTPKTLSILSPTTFRNVLNHQEINALQKIQNSARRKISMKKANAQDRWKIFADLDSADEAEMLQLACYFQTFFQFVPGMNNDNSGTKQNVPPTPSLLDDDDFTLGSIEITEPVHSEPRDKTGKNMRNYEIESKVIDQAFVETVIDLYRHGGRLNVKTLVRIMRQAYKLLKDLPNVTRLSIDPSSKLTIVGDIHGQLSDLLYILDESGLPSQQNKYIFNGDFVDRGDHGLEVIIILFALLCAFGPDSVVLNRGNHEDDAVCRVYGFEEEVKSKYSDVVVFDMFAEIFRFLPVCSVIQDKVLVIHGGLFHEENVSIRDDLSFIERMNYHPKLDYYYSEELRGSHNSYNEANVSAVVAAMTASELEPEGVEKSSKSRARKEFLNKLFREALWSDPDPNEGISPSKRGIGVQFGPNIAKKFMELNGLSMVVRSHECALTGFDLPYAKTHIEKFHHAGNLPPTDPLLCTIFSASNYCQQDNDGAYLVFRVHPSHNSAAVQGSDLHFSIHRHKTSESSLDISHCNHSSLSQLIHRRLGALELAFETLDVGNSGLVSKVEWAETMSAVTGIKIRWLSLISTLAPESCIQGEKIDYEQYLQSFSLDQKYGSVFCSEADMDNAAIQSISASSSSSSSISNSTISMLNTNSSGPTPRSPVKNECFSPRLSIKSLDIMYAQRKKLETIFYFFDKNGDGVISKEEFKAGCQALNQMIDPKRQLRNIDRTLELMDLEKSGNININEFFEIFRILESKDPKFVAGLGCSSPKLPNSPRWGLNDLSTPRSIQHTISHS